MAGEPLEYTGTAVELLIGFLIGLAILIPLYVVFFLGALSLGPIGQFASVLSFPLLVLFGQFAVYRARRYRLTRTVYRGVRFHQDGSAVRYAFCAIFWWFVVGITIGLAYPFMQSRLERYKMRHTYYGNLKGAFVGSGFRLFFRGFRCGFWLCSIAVVLVVLIVKVDWPAVSAVIESKKPNTLFIDLWKIQSVQIGTVLGAIV